MSSTRCPATATVVIDGKDQTPLSPLRCSLEAGHDEMHEVRNDEGALLCSWHERYDR